MEWLFDNPQVFFVIIIVAISLIKKVFDAKKAAENPPIEEEDPFESWEQVPERPAPSVPPPLDRRHVPPNARRSIPPPPPLPSGEADSASQLKRHHEMMERLQHAKEIKAARATKATKATTTGGAAATQDRVSGTGKSTTGQGLRVRLRNRSEIRKAILMREILDRPLGLR